MDRDSVSITLHVPKGREADLYNLIQKHPDIIPGFQFPYLYDTKQIFISYRRKDSEDVCGRIYDRLSAAFNNVFKDTEAIPAGVDFRFELERAVAACNVMLVIIGKQWDSAVHLRRLNDPNDFVRIEIEAALKRDIPVIPVFVHRRTKMPDRKKLPPTLHPLTYRNARQARPDPDFHRDLDGLIQDIQDIFDLIV
ncbi:MAG: toll/interleukin-1 receptor domain-containing protein [Chloroflexota bacterium]